MNKSIRIISALFMILTLLSACGGGGGGNSSPQTAVGTSVSLATAKAYQLGTAPAGSHLDFNLSGSDTQGSAWTGSYSIISDGATSFEGINVTKSRVLITLTRTSTGASVIGDSTSYFLQSDRSLYKTVSSSNVTGTPTSQVTIPDIAHVGDSGNLWPMAYSDGTSSSSTWRLDPDINGNSKLVSSVTLKDASNAVTSLEDQTIYLDANGNPYRLEDRVVVNGVTVTLAGNKI